MHKQSALYLFILFLLATACQEDTPDTLPPVALIEEVQNITRTGSQLWGKIENKENAVVTRQRFLYGTTTDMENQVTATSASGNKVTATLEGLKPGTTYYYCLEVGNEKSSVRSQSASFQTLPNKTPVLGEVELIGAGPSSGLFQCKLIDNGGESLTASGFAYREEGKEEHFVETGPGNNNLFRTRISGLNFNSRYIVRCYAENSVGRTYSEGIELETKASVMLSIPGTLPEIIGEENKYTFTVFAISGTMNGTDIRFLRDMLGRDVQNNPTAGKLAQLDLTEATIVEGGLTYNETRYTENNVIGYGMFQDCLYLTSIKLPETAKAIEQNAFKGSSALTIIHVPSKIEKLEPSDGCIQLTAIEVSKANIHFASIEGVLYNYSKEKLIWYPKGKPDATFTFPETIKELNEYAFLGCLFTTVTLPESIRQIPTGVFQQCVNLASVVLGKETELLGNYCFDGCPLQELTVLADIPPVCQSNTFSGVATENFFDNCVLYVPSASRSMYRSSSTWSKFSTIRPYSP